MKAIFTFSFLCIISIAANATDLSLVGSWSYEISQSNETVRVYGDKIKNSSSGGHSGSIKLALYLTTSKYYGGSISGYALGEYRFNPDYLNGGQYFYNIDKTTSFSVTPPDGDYYVTLLLLEYQSNDFYIVDYVTFNNTISFGNSGGEDISVRLSFSGDWSVDINQNADQVTITGDKFYNWDYNDNSNAIKIDVFLMDSRYSGGDVYRSEIQGYLIADYTFNSLSSGSNLTNIYETTGYYQTPPYGSYYVTIVLSECWSSGYVINDYINIPNQVFIGTNDINTTKNEIDKIIYPNPASDILYINTESDNIRVLITDLDGKTVLDQVINNKEIDVKEIPTGLYLIKIFDHSDISIKKFVKY